MTVEPKGPAKLLLQSRLDALHPTTSSTDSNRSYEFLARLKMVLLVCVGILLIWEVATRSLGAYLADVWPEMAIRLRSTNSEALLNLAEAQLKVKQAQFAKLASTKSSADNQGTSDPEISGREKEFEASSSSPSNSRRSVKSDPAADAQAGSRIEFALFNDPLNSRAFGFLGQLRLFALLAKDVSDVPHNQRVELLTRTAARLSRHEGFANYWMMIDRYQERDFAAAIRYADTLLRTRSPEDPFFKQALAMLGRLAENVNASAELKSILASDPPWRSAFFEHLPENVTDSRVPLDILLSLKKTSAPPTITDLRSYVNFLVDRSLYSVAYYTWLQFLPPEQLSKATYLYNGDFGTTPSKLPFDWSIADGTNVSTKILKASDDDGKQGIYIKFGPGRVDWAGIKQLIVLPPGDYSFQGSYTAEIDSKRGLRWQVLCAGKASAQLGESPAVKGLVTKEAAFSFNFSVPDNDCPAQYVQMVFDARWASEQFITGSAWYGKLEIQPGYAIKKL